MTIIILYLGVTERYNFFVEQCGRINLKVVLGTEGNRGMRIHGYEYRGSVSTEQFRSKLKAGS